MQRKILVVCYYWPPSGGAGVQRWLLNTKYLSELGEEVHVYCPENPEYPVVDSSFLEEVDSRITVVKRKIIEPFALAKLFFSKTKSYQKGQFELKKKQGLLSRLMVFVRGNFFIPDARVLWVKPSVLYLNKYIQKKGITHVVTTGPPHSMHLIGLGLKRRNLKTVWISDFRDPWTTISYHKALRLTQWAQNRHKVLEKKVLLESDAIVATSYSDADFFRAITPRDVKTITNGFDGEIVQEDKDASSSRFSLMYVGGLEYARNPEPLWKALSRILASNKAFASLFSLDFVGSISNEVREDLSQFGLDKYTKFHGYVAHKDLAYFMLQADVLWLTNFNNKASKGIIPGKLFEYLKANRPIVSIGTEDADVSKILEWCSAGKHFTYSESDKLKQFLEHLFDSRNGDREYFPNHKKTQQFHRLELAKQWVQLFDDLKFGS